MPSNTTITPAIAGLDSLDSIDLLGLANVSVPYFQQYFGLWLMAEESFQGVVQSLRGFDLSAHLLTFKARSEAQAASGEGGGGSTKLSVTPDGIAVIPLRGMLMKQESSYGSNTSTVAARRQVRAAAASSDVRAILLQIESPGGTVSGTKELASDIAAAAAQKPVWSACEDLCASAAYWLAAQSTRIAANDMASVGSIGTYGVVTDYSAAAASQGVKVHVVRAGSFKGLGTPGTEVSAEQLAYLQKHITDVNEHFLAGVASGRKLSLESVRAMADGRTHLASAAKSMGLIDAVESLDETLNQLRVSLSKQPGRSSKMSTENANAAANAVATLQPQIATLDEITAACPGADDTFVLSQLRVKATVAQATSAWMKQLSENNAKLTASQKETEEKLKAATTEQASKPVKPGVQPVNAGATATKGSSSSEDPVVAWEEGVNEKVKAGMTKAAAVRALVIENPELHTAYIAAYTAEHAPKITVRR